MQLCLLTLNLVITFKVIIEIDLDPSFNEIDTNFSE